MRRTETNSREGARCKLFRSSSCAPLVLGRQRSLEPDTARRREVLREEGEAQKDADDAGGDVEAAEHVVLAAEPRRGREHDVLLALEGRHREAVLDHDLVRPGLQLRRHAAVELAERGEGRQAHPDHEVEVLRVGDLVPLLAEVPSVGRRAVDLPRHVRLEAEAEVPEVLWRARRVRRRVVLHRRRRGVLDARVARPRDVLLLALLRRADWFAGGGEERAVADDGAVSAAAQREAVVEHRPRDEAARVVHERAHVERFRAAERDGRRPDALVLAGAQQRVAVRHVVGGRERAGELQVAARLGVPPVVLVEVVELVVHEHGRLHVLRDVDRDAVRAPGAAAAGLQVVVAFLHFNDGVARDDDDDADRDEDDAEDDEDPDHPRRRHDGLPRRHALLFERRRVVGLLRRGRLRGRRGRGRGGRRHHTSGVQTQRRLSRELREVSPAPFVARQFVHTTDATRGAFWSVASKVDSTGQ
mmetsp:Transcript_820/g.2832  ORF Transcript_820/g.2832 Transcript_820/m.2832 type:complete len:473 (+) Transcript_820:302-1720(+)